MEREIINLSEYEIVPILNEYGIEDREYWDEEKDTIKSGVWDNFELIDSEIGYVDLEKGYEEIRVIVRRISDNKFFKGFYIYSPYFTEYDTTLIEVYPKTTTITIYE